MNWAWASSLDHVWRSHSLPLWLTLAAAGFFGMIVLITLLRAEKSVANGALTVITLLAIAVASAATLRGFSPGEGDAPMEARPVHQAGAALPQLSCIDDLAGDAVLNACEKVLFGSAESAAAAVAYAAFQITRLTAYGDVASANKSASSDLLALRRAVERDRYGLMAYVLMARDHCTSATCPVFRSLGDYRQVAANMDDRVYESMITRHAASWNAPAASSPAGLLAALPGSAPTGKPTNAEFPSSANTPPVSIMTPEPPAGAAPRPPASAAAPAAPRPAALAPPPGSPQAQAAAKKPPPPPKRPPATAAAPVQIAPAASAPTATNTE